jgi:hypothetical protein
LPITKNEIQVIQEKKILMKLLQISKIYSI